MTARRLDDEITTPQQLTRRRRDGAALDFNNINASEQSSP
jgi:hypothetical protein